MRDPGFAVKLTGREQEAEGDPRRPRRCSVCGCALMEHALNFRQDGVVVAETWRPDKQNWGICADNQIEQMVDMVLAWQNEQAERDERSSSTATRGTGDTDTPA